MDPTPPPASGSPLSGSPSSGSPSSKGVGVWLLAGLAVAGAVGLGFAMRARETADPSKVAVLPPEEPGSVPAPTPPPTPPEDPPRSVEPPAPPPTFGEPPPALEAPPTVPQAPVVEDLPSPAPGSPDSPPSIPPSSPPSSPDGPAAVEAPAPPAAPGVPIEEAPPSATMPEPPAAPPSESPAPQVPSPVADLPSPEASAPATPAAAEPAGPPDPLPRRAVPDVVGLPRVEALARMRQAGFAPRVLSERDAPPGSGLVIRQAPFGGTAEDAGASVELTVGPAQGDGRSAETPDVTQFELRDAVTALVGKGFVPLAIPASAVEVDGRVRTQTPAAGTTLRTGAVVRVEVPAPASSDVAEVPSVVGLPREEASERLSRAGLTTQELIVVRVRPGIFRWAPDSVIAQWPVGRVARSEAESVTMWVIAR